MRSGAAAQCVTIRALSPPIGIRGGLGGGADRRRRRLRRPFGAPPDRGGPKPFRVEVVVDAPVDVVWAALTDPTEIRRWFGWCYAGLDEEIAYIFRDYAALFPPDRIELEDDQAIELLADGLRTVVSVVRAGSRTGAWGDEVHDENEQGWRAFLSQLQHYLEAHPGEERRTVFLEGEAAFTQVVAGVAAMVPAEALHTSHFQQAFTADGDVGLVVVAAQLPFDSGQAGPMHVTLTTYGLDAPAFDELTDRWLAWWTSVAQDPKATV